MFGSEHYNARACEFEGAAGRVSDFKIRASYIELAQSFREMAKVASLASTLKGDEATRLAERMIGKPSRASPAAERAEVVAIVESTRRSIVAA